MNEGLDQMLTEASPTSSSDYASPESLPEGRVFASSTPPHSGIDEPLSHCQQAFAQV
jgi:hypothetical protein